jgi:flavin-dependent dehydrogenase
MRTPQRYDAAVLGGGPAGSAAAIALGRAGLQVVVVHRDEGADFRVGEGLPPTAKGLLRELGVLRQFEAGGHLPSYGNQSAWGSAMLMATDFIRHPHGHGWHLDRCAFDAMLLDAAREHGAEIIGCERIAGAGRDEDGWSLDLVGVTGVAARFVIDATGRSSWLARRAGAARIDDDALMAYIAVVPAEDEDSLTLIEAVESGWWYTALLPRGRRVVVFHTDADLYDGNFTALLGRTRYIRQRCGAIGEPMIRRANGARLDRLFGDGWAAAGDAAVSFDPLSSQGIMTALYSGLRVAGAVVAARSGDRGALASYATALAAIHDSYRRQHNLVYSAERRWPEHPFWQRRDSVTSTEPTMAASAAGKERGT